MVRAFVGLGSNIGDRLENLRRAVAAIAASERIEVSQRSSVYDTDPVGPPQSNFLNAVIGIETTLDARDLLARLKQIEAELGRREGKRWGPREIDLDLLIYDDEKIDEPDLVVPHPEMWDRAFVLVPLAEIAPDFEARTTEGVRKTADSL